MAAPVPQTAGHRMGEHPKRACLHHDAGGAAAGVHRQHGGDGDVQRRDAELLEEDLAHPLAVLLRAEGGLRQQDGGAGVVRPYLRFIRRVHAARVGADPVPCEGAEE